jgi:hypothetical protein
MDGVRDASPHHGGEAENTRQSRVIVTEPYVPNNTTQECPTTHYNCCVAFLMDQASF